MPSVVTKPTLGRASLNIPISVGMMVIDAKCYSMTASDGKVEFKQLHKGCRQPISQKKCCGAKDGCDCIGEQLADDDIIKGVPVGDGTFVTFSEDELEQLKAQGDKGFVVKQFVRQRKLDTRLFSTGYFAVPSSQSVEAYSLLHSELSRRGLAGLGTITSRGKEQICTLIPVKNGFIVQQMVYPEQFREITDVAEVEEVKLTPGSKDLMKQLVDQSLVEEVDLSQFTNERLQRWEEMVEAKKAGKELEFDTPIETPKPSGNVMDLLRASLAIAAPASDAAPVAAQG